MRDARPTDDHGNPGRAAATACGRWRAATGRRAPRAEPATPAAEIARRVEALRGLRYDEIPRPVAVTPEQARREGLEDLDRSYPEARRRADEQVLKLLGLIDPAVDLRDVSASVFSEGVAGYYDPRTKRMRTVRGAATGTRVLAEMVLAHELTHALEDQRFGLGLADQGGSDDAALARLALVEGSASELMYAYARPPLHARGDARRRARQRVRRHGLAAGLPAGAARVPLHGRGGVRGRAARAGRRALDARGPRGALAAAGLHRAGHAPGEVGPGGAAAAGARTGARRALGAGWERAAGGVLGEFQTRELLARAGGGGSADAAEGWGGDRYELWRRGGEDCAAPCRRAAALVARWRWDTPARRARVRGQAAPVGPRRARRRWRAGSVAVAQRGGAVTLAMAPSGSLARRLAAG